MVVPVGAGEKATQRAFLGDAGEGGGGGGGVGRRGVRERTKVSLGGL